MKIVQSSVQHLTELQYQIKSFLDFLGNISKIIDETVESSEFVYDTAEDTDGLTDRSIKKVWKLEITLNLY
jgi:hypothetical protein